MYILIKKYKTLVSVPSYPKLMSHFIPKTYVPFYTNFMLRWDKRQNTLHLLFVPFLTICIRWDIIMKLEVKIFINKNALKSH